MLLLVRITSQFTIFFPNLPLRCSLLYRNVADFMYCVIGIVLGNNSLLYYVMISVGTVTFYKGNILHKLLLAT